MKLIKKLLLFTVVIVSFYSPISAEIKIIYKINNEIITNHDIEKEYKFLIFFNKNLEKLNKKDLLKIATKSIIKEKIKKIEIEKSYKIKKENFTFEDINNNFNLDSNINNEEDLGNYLKNFNLNLDEIKLKLEIERMWNQLVFDKFSYQINIDENKLRNKLKKNQQLQKKFITAYLLSEILFSIERKEMLNDEFKKIKQSINDIGFKNSSITYGLSEASRKGGLIGWVDESQLSEEIINNLKTLKVNEFTNPISVPGGFLILQINDKKEKKIDYDLEEELKRLIVFEKNRQFNQFSTILFSKTKINSNIILVE